MLRLAHLHFTSEVIVFGFSSMSSFISGARAIFVNRLAKQLHMWSSLKYALTQSHAKPTRVRWSWVKPLFYVAVSAFSVFTSVWGFEDQLQCTKQCSNECVSCLASLFLAPCRLCQVVSPSRLQNQLIHLRNCSCQRCC